MRERVTERRRRGRRLLPLVLLAGCGAPEDAGRLAPPPEHPRARVGRAEAAELERLAPSLPSPEVTLAGRPFDTLRAAIDAARSGERIELGPGVHAGPIAPTLPVEIYARADAGDVVIASETPLCLRIPHGADVRMRGITLRGRGQRRVGAEATVMIAGGRLGMKECRIEADRVCAVQMLGGELLLEESEASTDTWQTCLQLGSESKAWLADCTIEARGPASAGVELWEANLHMERTHVAASTAAVAVGLGSKAIVDDSLLEGTTALWSSPRGRSTLAHSELRNAKIALRCQGRVELDTCTIADSETGVLVFGPDADLTLRDCLFARNVRNVTFEEAHPSQLEAFDTDI